MAAFNSDFGKPSINFLLFFLEHFTTSTKLLDTFLASNPQITFRHTSNSFEFGTCGRIPKSLRLSSVYSSYGPIRSDVNFGQLAVFVWFMETGAGLNVSVEATQTR